MTKRDDLRLWVKREPDEVAQFLATVAVSATPTEETLLAILADRKDALDIAAETVRAISESHHVASDKLEAAEAVAKALADALRREGCEFAVAGDILCAQHTENPANWCNRCKALALYDAPTDDRRKG